MISGTWKASLIWSGLRDRTGTPAYSEGDGWEATRSRRVASCPVGTKGESVTRAEAVEMEAKS